MKKLLVLMSLGLFGSIAYGYKIDIDNTYDGEVKLLINQAEGKSKEYVLPAKKESRVKTDKVLLGPETYCIEKMTFEATSGPAKGHKTVVLPPHTGYGIRCADLTKKEDVGGEKINVVTIMSAKDNTLVVELPEEESGHLYEVKNKSDRQVVAHFNRTAGKCSKNPQFLIEPGQTRNIKMGSCCISSILFRFASGSDPRKSNKWESNNPCGSHTLKIKEAKDHSLVIESK